MANLSNRKLKMENRSLEVLKFGSLEIKNDFKTSRPLDFWTSKAFTLAEVLITLGVIGVVAAITMPVLITNINERVNSERQANIAYKVTQAMELMRAQGKLVQYESTEKFVDELQKYLKIQKRCSANNIAECWPTETVTDSSGNEYDVADCQKRMDLLEGSNSNDNNVGLILADGASIILTYDASSEGISFDSPVISTQNYLLPAGNGKYKGYAYTTSVTGAIDFVMDVNGKKGPNSETRDGKYYDIRKFRSAKFGKGCADGRFNGQCISYLGTNYGYLNCRSENSDQEYYQKYCGSGSAYYQGEELKDAWAGAHKACDEAGMKLASISDLLAIYANIDKYNIVVYDRNDGDNWYWAYEEGTNWPTWHGAYVSMYDGSVGERPKPGPQTQVICVGK